MASNYIVGVEQRTQFMGIQRLDGSTLEADPNEVVTLSEHPKGPDGEPDPRFVPTALKANVPTPVVAAKVKPPRKAAAKKAGAKRTPVAKPEAKTDTPEVAEGGDPVTEPTEPVAPATE